MILNHPGLAVAAVRREIIATMAQMKALGEVIASMPGDAPPDKVANLVTKFRTAEADLARLVARFGPIGDDDKVINLSLLRSAPVTVMLDEPPPEAA
jgi:hypothetical protein